MLTQQKFQYHFLKKSKTRTLRCIYINCYNTHFFHLLFEPQLFRKLIFAFENCQNSFSWGPTFNPFWSAKYLDSGSESCEIGIFSRSILKTYTLRKIKGFTFSIMLRINSKVFRVISWSLVGDKFLQILNISVTSTCKFLVCMVTYLSLSKEFFKSKSLVTVNNVKAFIMLLINFIIH